ncbi:DUF2946 family protein [Caballeronia sp. LZ016]|uniref:DUF2946 family protein n=1 Tax=Caballeronia sp. LZ016 TaxID=3038554 RepID=UPI002854887A|nr:DUF2946 family protein [Caballeronia sp. LZ016]MDR5738437.1 DUF2946 family protein [Caballeronia sp. LZ016]
MTRNARNRFVAWLGIAAMWLAFVAPVISQSIAARNGALDTEAAFCTVDTLPRVFATADEHAHHHLDADNTLADNADADAEAGEHAAHASHAEAGEHAGHFDACSYCGLLAHHLPVVFAASHAVASTERVARATPVAAHDPVSTKSFNAAAPRAPPVLS